MSKVELVNLGPNTVLPLVVRVFWRAAGVAPRDHNFADLEDALDCARRYAGQDKVAKVELMVRLASWKQS